MTTLKIEDLQEAVKNSTNFAQVCRYLGRKDTGGSYEWTKSKIIEFGIDYSHFDRSFNKFIKRQDIDYSKKFRRKKGHQLRRLLVENGIEHKCSKCPNTGEWLGEPITLEVDHIDGDWSNNSVENLRFLCPNCHSQETTKKVKQKKKKYFCDRCKSEEIGRSAKYCDECVKIVISEKAAERSKINWPSDEELTIMVLEMPMTIIGKKIGVNANSVKKRCMKRGIKLPPKNCFSGRIWKQGE